MLYLLRVVALRRQGARDLSRRLDWGRDGWLRPRDMEKAQEPILSTDCARLPDLSFVAPLQMETPFRRMLPLESFMGWTRVRFLAPVKAGARVRPRVTLMELEQEGASSQVRTSHR